MTSNDSTMTGLWLEGGVAAIRDDLPVPNPGPGEALIEMVRAGICGTDLQMLAGYVGFRGVMGHEFVGRVVSGPAELFDRRVVGEINVVCGRCAQCVAGRGAHCETRTVLGIRGRNGAFARYFTLPVANLHRLPEAISDDEGVFVEPLAAALRIRQQVEITPDCRVLVAGAGRLGQLIARALALTGCQLTVLARHRIQLELLREAGISAIDRPPPDGAFDVAVDCTGHPSGFDVARRALRPCGTLVLKSTYSGDLRIDPSALVVNEIRLVGSRCGPFGPAIQALASGAVDVRPLVQTCLPLRRARRALRVAACPGALKVLLRPD